MARHRQAVAGKNLARRARAQVLERLPGGRGDEGAPQPPAPAKGTDLNIGYATALLISAATSLLVAGGAWRRRPARATSGLAFIGVSLFAWSFIYALCWLSNDPAWQARLMLLSYVGVVSAPLAGLVFALQYTRRERFLSPRFLALLAIEPLTTFVMIVTDPYHGLFLGDHAVTTTILDGGPWFWFDSAYDIALVLFSTALLIGNLRHAQAVYRRQGVVVLVAYLVPVVGVVLSLGGLSPWPGLDITPVTFTVTCILLALALFRLGLVDLVPLARSQLIDSMSEGVMVLDESGLILDVNPAALQLTGIEGDCVGEPAAEVFVRWPDELAALQRGDGEVIFESPDTSRVVEATVARVHDAKNEALVAIVVTLRDITERRRIAAAEREQRALAEALRASAEALNSSYATDDVLDAILDNIERVAECDAAAIVTGTEPDGTPVVRRARGYAERTYPEVLEDPNNPINEPLYARLRDTRRPLVHPDVTADPDWAETQLNAWIRACMATALFVRGRLIGYLFVHSATVGTYQQTDGDAIAALGEQAAVALENARLHSQLELMATTDPLTGALNRRGFAQLAEREATLARRSGAFLALLAVDVDHFKTVNDECGHATGDEVLRRVVNACQASLRTTDVIGRSGGDEFAILLLGTDLETARTVAERVRDAVTRAGEASAAAGDVAVSVSIGVAARAGSAVDLDELSMAADRALYEAKDAGRDRVSVEGSHPALTAARSDARP